MEAERAATEVPLATPLLVRAVLMGAVTEEEVRHIAHLLPPHCSQVLAVPLAEAAVVEPQRITIMIVKGPMGPEAKSESFHGR